MLQVKHLHKYYSSREGIKHHALKGINLEFPNQGFVVILGKSGSGKSTLLNIIGGLDQFDQGEIIINNQSTKDFNANLWDSYRNTYVGFVFQEFYLIDEYTIGKNISLALELQGYPKEDINKKVIEILRIVDLEDYIHRNPNELSGGQKQRIALCRALIKDPKIILADEPTGNLDSETGKMILDIVKKLSQEKLVIMVTHDAEFAREYGDYIIELKDGEVISDRIKQLQTKSYDEIYSVESNDVKSVLYLPKGRHLAQKQIDYLNDLLLKSNQDIYVNITNDQSKLSVNIPEVKVNTIEKKEFSKDVSTIDTISLKRLSFPFKNAFHLAISSLLRRKLRLSFMLILFVFSLVFVGIATNLSFYNPSKAALLTFEKEDITVIPISKEIKYCFSNGKNCSTRTSDVKDSEIVELKQTFPSISFYPIISTQYQKFNDLFNDIKVNYEEDQFYYRPHVNRINIIDENTNQYFEIRFGSYSYDYQSIMITDYLAEVLLYYQAFSDIDSIDDFVGRRLSNHLIITGIVKTDYDKYDYLKKSTDSNDFKNEAFYSDVDQKYAQFYMSNKTYEDYFLSVNLINVITKITEDERLGEQERGIMLVSDIPKTKYIESLLEGRLPEENHEIALSIQQIKNYILTRENREITVEEANTYLNQEFVFGYKLVYENNRYIEKTYKVVGIIEEDASVNRVNVVNALFSKDEFLYLSDTTSYSQEQNQGVVANLGNNQTENIKFITSLEKSQYRHNTEVSSMLQYLSYTTKNFRTVFLIIGAAITVFASILILTFISTSIYDKKKQIGILRAMGARGIDVSKIFLIESLIIAFISGIFASAFTAIAIRLFNQAVVNDFNIPIILLYLNISTVLIIFLLATVVVLLSSYIPLKRITLMKPINAIKNY